MILTRYLSPQCSWFEEKFECNPEPTSLRRTLPVTHRCKNAVRRLVEHIRTTNSRIRIAHWHNEFGVFLIFDVKVVFEQANDVCASKIKHANLCICCASFEVLDLWSSAEENLAFTNVITKISTQWNATYKLKGNTLQISCMHALVFAKIHWNRLFHRYNSKLSQITFLYVDSQNIFFWLSHKRQWNALHKLKEMRYKISEKLKKMRYRYPACKALQFFCRNTLKSIAPIWSFANHIFLMSHHKSR